MRDHTVAVDATQTPTALTFADNFNVAVPFIDRHVTEGRGAKVAIRDAAGDVSYAELADNVNRAGNALAALGLDPGDRVLMVVKDCPAFFYLFWSAIKAGFVPVPLNTLLRAADYRFVIENSRAACIVWSPEFAGEVEPALAEASYRPAHALPAEGEGDSLAAPPHCGIRRAGAGAGDRRRSRVLALHIGIDRHAQGRRPSPPRHGGD